MKKGSAKREITMDGIAKLVASSQRVTIKHLEKRISQSYESLARSVAEGFAGVDKRFEEIGTKFEGLRQQVEGTNGRIDKLVDEKVSVTDHKMLADRVSRLEIATHVRK